MKINLMIFLYHFIADGGDQPAVQTVFDPAAYYPNSYYPYYPTYQSPLIQPNSMYYY